MTDVQGQGYDPTTNKVGGVAYGTLNMKMGKKWPVAERQIRGITKEHGDVLMWMFDFVCNPNQIDTAQEYAAKAHDLITDLCPDLNLNHVVMGIATKDEDRPAKQVMMGIAAKMDATSILSTIDFSTERIFLWVGGKLQG